MNRSRPARAGYVWIDAVVGLGIVSSLSIVLVTTVSRQHTAELRLADARAALHLAEQTLLNVQHGQPAPLLAPDSRLQLIPVTGDTPKGYGWVRVSATVHGLERSLVGIVPAAAVPTSGGHS